MVESLKWSRIYAEEPKMGKGHRAIEKIEFVLSPV
jgi:hypothetical protein